jgi:AraC-like DNA-binding protein
VAYSGSFSSTGGCESVGVGAQALPPVQRHQFTTTDPEHAHAFLRRNYTAHSVRFSGSLEGFTFAQTMTSAQNFSVGRMRYSVVVQTDSGPLEGKLIIAQLLSGCLEISVGREAVCATRGAQPLLMPPSRSIHTEWDNHEVGMVTLDPAMVADYGAGVSGLGPAGLEFTGMEPISPLMARHWQSVVRHVAREVLPNPEAMASPLIVGQTQRLLAASVLTTFPNTALNALTDSTTVPVGVVEPAALRRAVAFIDAHAGEDIGIAEITQAARLGPRGLQQAFRRYRDTTPMGYLRRVRLDHAHRELLAGDPTQGDTVSAIAARWGFPHPGRFSKAYHTAYGRLPSHTLHQ